MNRTLNKNRGDLFFTLFLIYLSVLLFLLVSGSTGFNYNQFPYQDKLLHFAAFFCGQFLIMFSNVSKNLFRKSLYLFFILLPLLAEYIQHHIPTRVTDKWDMIAGYLGIAVCVIPFMGVKLIRFWQKKIKNQVKN